MKHRFGRLRRMEVGFDRWGERFVRKHPWMGFVMVFMGFPVLISVLVYAGAATVLLPILRAAGWLG